MHHRFPVGTQYKSTGKHPRTMTVCDQMTLTNAAGEVVRCFYWAYSEMMGQRVIDHDVCDTTIARGMDPIEFKKILESSK